MVVGIAQGVGVIAKCQATDLSGVQVEGLEAQPSQSPEEPEQLSLIDDGEEPAPKPKPRPRRKRASVPSWDEIMFGAPHAPKSDD